MTDATSHRVGVVLAAGFGSRLAGVYHATDLKPLTPVAGTPLIVRTLQSLEVAGCDQAVIVLGYKPEILQAAIQAVYRGPLALTFVYNSRYYLQNGLSVLAARPYVGDEFVLMMADHVIGEEVMERARYHTPAPGGATLLVDHKLDTIFDMDDATKVLEAQGHIQAIGKTLTHYNSVDIGVFVCTTGLMEALQAVVDEKGDASLSEGVRRLADHGRMHSLDIGDGFWQDVDTPAMLAHAEVMLEERERVAVWVPAPPRAAYAVL